MCRLVMLSHFKTVAKAQVKLSAQICRLAIAVYIYHNAISKCDKYQNLALSQMAISVSFLQAENALENRLT